MKEKTMFFMAKGNFRAKKVDITSPAAFRKSIKEMKKGKYTLNERRSLILAQNRAKAQLARKSLSPKERRQFTQITKIRIPK